MLRFWLPAKTCCVYNKLPREKHFSLGEPAEKKIKMDGSSFSQKKTWRTWKQFPVVVNLREVSWEKSAPCDITVATASFSSNVFEKWSKQEKQRLCFLWFFLVPVCFSGVYRQTRDTFYCRVTLEEFSHIRGPLKQTKKWKTAKR